MADLTPTPPATPWPWPADTRTDRARRMAWSYRAALAEHAPEVCARIDQWAAQRGEGWVTPLEFPYDDDDLITRRKAAELFHVDVHTVYTWHRRGLPYTDTADGIRVRVGDLLAFERTRRQARRKRADRPAERS